MLEVECEGVGKLDLYSSIYRSWYYFRVGYNTYLSFPFAYIGFLALIYQEIVVNFNLATSLGPITSNVVNFEIAVAIIVSPVGVVVGYLHVKHTRAYVSEVDIGVEANPWVYKLQPGKEKEAFAPIYLVTLRLLKKLADKESLLTQEEKQEISVLESRMNTLLEGKFVSKPKRRI